MYLMDFVVNTNSNVRFNPPSLHMSHEKDFLIVQQAVLVLHVLPLDFSTMHVAELLNTEPGI